MTAEIKVPDLGESIVEATVGRWLMEVGDQVNIGDPVVELETDKVDLEVGAEVAGVLSSIEALQGKDVKVGEVLGKIDPNGVPAGKQGDEPAEEEQVRREEGQPEEHMRPDGAESEREPKSERAGGAGPSVQASPVAERLAEEHGIKLDEITGSGSGGRITRSDVEQAVSARESPAAEPDRGHVDPQPHGNSGRRPGERSEERMRMSRRRRTIARRLVEAQTEAAMLTTFNDVDMGPIMRLRRDYGSQFEDRHSLRLGITSFFVRASVIALREFPELNASIDGDEIVRKYYYDIGIAVGAQDGLVVPVIRDADQASFAEIEAEIARFALAAKAGDLTLDDLRGGTFSITNGGVFGSLLSTPILNPPQAAILGLHRIEERPVVREGQVTVSRMMYLALTYDHRLVDGRQAVQFLARIKEMIEDPGTLVVES